MTNIGRLIFNYSVMSGGTAVSIILGIIVIPFLISKLGEDAFGLTVLFSSIFMVANIAEAGLSVSSLRYFSMCAAKNDVASFNKMFSTGILIALFFSLLNYLITLGLSGEIISLFKKIPPELERVAEDTLPIFVLGSSLNAFVFPMILSVFNSFHRFDISSLLRTGTRSVQVLAWFAVLSLTPWGFEGWIYSNVAVMLLSVIVAYIAAKFYYKPLRFNPLSANISTAGKLFSMSVKVVVTNLAIFASNGINPFLFSAFGSMAMNAIYQAATKPSSIMMMIINQASGQFLPHLTKSYACSDTARLKRIYLDSCRVLFSFSALVSVIAIIYSDLFFEVWLQKSMPENWSTTAVMFSWLIVSALILTVPTVQYPLLMAVNKLNALAVFFLFRTVITASASVYLLTCTSWGVYSVLFVIIPSDFITMLVQSYLVCRNTGISLKEQFCTIYHRGLISAAALFIVAELIKNFLIPNADALARLLTYSSISAVVAAILFLSAGLSKSDRDRLRAMPACGKAINVLRNLKKRLLKI